MRSTYETWQRRSGIASWTFGVPVRQNEDPADALRRCTSNVFVALSGFARVHDVDIVTVEHGEDPNSNSISGTMIDSQGLGVVFDRPEHVTKVSLSLDHTIGLHLSIDIDIYSPTTWGKQRENRELAELNAPRLSKFLAIVRRDLGGTCDAIDAEDYPGLVDETGFRVG